MEEDRERPDIERATEAVGRIENLAERATHLERWAASRQWQADGRTDRPAPAPAGSDGIDAQARIGHTDGTVFRWDEASGQWIPFGRIEDPWTLARALAGREGEGDGSERFAAPDRDRFPTADAVLDWWPVGDDTYRGTDGYRVEPPGWLARYAEGWIPLEAWQSALRTPRQAGRPRSWNRQLEAYLEGSRNERTPEWVEFGAEDGRACSSPYHGAEEREAVAGAQDGPGPYYWPGTSRRGRIASLAEFARWAAHYRQAWELEQGRQPPASAQPASRSVRATPGPFGRVVDERRVDARRNLRWESRTLRRAARSVRDTEARRFVVAVREVVRWESTALEWRTFAYWDRTGPTRQRAADLARWIGHEASLWWAARPRRGWDW